MTVGFSVAPMMSGPSLLRSETLLIMGFGVLAFVFDTVCGVLFVKAVNLFAREKINPLIGGAGISAFPMSSRVVPADRPRSR